MAANFTEEELKKLLKNNPKIKINDDSSKKSISKIKLLDNLDEEKPKKKQLGVKVSDINKLNKEAIVKTSLSKDHVSILFEGAKLISVNQIFAILQYRKYEIFTYKKVWHELIKKVLDELKLINKSIPYFDDSVEIILFRQASRLVDEDAMSTMFKYIIDGLKRDLDVNPNGILAEDNPKIVHRIVCYSEKGTPAIGIKVKRLEEKKQKFSAEDILKD